MNYKDRYKWVVLAISFLLMASFSISLQFLPPIFSQMIEDIPFSNSQAGMLMSAYAIPGIFLPFLIALLADRFDKKIIIIIALLIMIIGLVAFSLANSFSTLLIYRLFAGMGATVLVVLAPLLVTMFFQKENIGIAMGIFNMALPFGTVVATNLFGILGEKVQWQFLVLGIAILVAIVLAIIFFFLSLPKGNQEEKSNKENKDLKEEEVHNDLWSNWNLWKLAFIWTLANAQLIAYVTFGSQYFQEAGMTIKKSGLLTSFIMLVPIFLSPIVGIIIDRIGWKKQLILVGSIIMAVSFILIGKVTSSFIIWAIALGIGFTPIPVIVFALLPEITKSNQVSMGLGVLTSASNLGITLGPSIFGLLLDRTKGNFSISFIALALASLGIIVALGILNIETSQESLN